jgi:hypothetical protein
MPVYVYPDTEEGQQESEDRRCGDLEVALIGVHFSLHLQAYLLEQREHHHRVEEEPHV